MTFKKYIQDETILKTLEVLEYESMLPVQDKVIPVLQQRKDSIIQSKTGSGKTLSCLLYTSPSPRDRVISRMPSSA